MMVMNMPPSASVVIPTFNAEQWIGITLQSFVDQSTHDFEVIVVDDGSDDKTLDVIAKYQSKLNLRVLNTDHSGGPSRPRNIGIDSATAELIVFCDADDLALPDRIKMFVAAWEVAGKIDCLIFSDFSEIDSNGAILLESSLHKFNRLMNSTTKSISDEIVLLDQTDAFDALLAGNFLRPSSVAVPKRLLESFGGYDESANSVEDFELYIRIAHQYPFVWIRRPLSRYRHTPGNISSRTAIYRAPIFIMVRKRLLLLPLEKKQLETVNKWIAVNYESLGYEYGNEGMLRAALASYYRAFSHSPQWHHLRAAAIAMLKALLWKIRKK